MKVSVHIELVDWLVNMVINVVGTKMTSLMFPDFCGYFHCSLHTGILFGSMCHQLIMKLLQRCIYSRVVVFVNLYVQGFNLLSSPILVQLFLNICDKFQ